jgi:hypothetical protein
VKDQMLLVVVEKAENQVPKADEEEAWPEVERIMAAVKDGVLYLTIPKVSSGARFSTSRCSDASFWSETGCQLPLFSCARMLPFPFFRSTIVLVALSCTLYHTSFDLMDSLDLLCVIYNAETLSLGHFSGSSLISPLHSLGLLRCRLLTWILHRRRLLSIYHRFLSFHVPLHHHLHSFPFKSVIGIAFTPLFSF